MKILKNIAIAFVVIFVIAGVVIYFLPNRYTVTNTVVIDRPSSLVYQQVSDFNKWQAWSPWREMEPTAKLTVEGDAGQEGHKMTWEGQKVGKGNMILKAFDENEALLCVEVIEGFFTFTSKDYWRFEPDSSGKTKVTWTTSGGLVYPHGRLFGLAVNKVVSEPEKQGLENLKKVCEAMPAPVLVAMADSTSDSTVVAPK